MRHAHTPCTSDGTRSCADAAAERRGHLQEAFEKDAKGAETLANLVTISLHQGKPASRYLK
jgi:Coatomer epsilon subunit